MTLRFLGKDPDSKDGDSPLLWYDDADGSVVVQGWKESDIGTIQRCPPGDA